jgi:hypothetical protein
MRIYHVLPILVLAILCACSTTRTQTGREESARPRIEQRALNSAMEKAFAAIDFSIIADKTVFVETQAQSKIDLDYITAFIYNKIIANGGIPEKKEDSADIKLLNIAKVSGTDEISRRIVSDIVRGEYNSSLTFIDIKRKKVIKTYELNAETDEKR